MPIPYVRKTVFLAVAAVAVVAGCSYVWEGDSYKAWFLVVLGITGVAWVVFAAKAPRATVLISVSVLFCMFFASMGIFHLKESRENANQNSDSMKAHKLGMAIEQRFFDAPASRSQLRKDHRGDNR